MRLPRSITRSFLAAAFLTGTLTTVPAQAETVLRIAMTAGDIPNWLGEPDQGFEGFRFVGFNLYDGLVNWDLSRSDVEADLRPGLATKWYIDPENHQKWIFELRHGVKYHDGCDWNADSAIWNFDRLMNEKNPAFFALNFARARSRMSNIDHLEKIDDYKIAIYTKTVESVFPYNLPFVLMMSKCALDKANNDFSRTSDIPVGTGPYKFDKVVPHERLELVRNSDYWDKNRIPKQDRVVLIPMPEASTRVAAILSGQVDMVEAPPPDAIDRLKAAGIKVITNIYPHTWPYLFNFKRGPFEDLRIRQAANYAVNRDEMVEMLGGIAVPSSGIFNPDQKDYGHPYQYKTDPAKATALLKEAGCYPCAINIAISTSGSGQMQPLPMNALVKEQLENAGFKVNFDTIDWNTMGTVFIQGASKYPQYDGINFSSGATDPDGFMKSVLTMFQAPNGSNWGGYSNPEVDKLGQQLLATFDPDEQTKLTGKMHELVVADAARLFIVSDLNPRALSPKLSGFVQAQSWFQDITPIVVAP